MNVANFTKYHSNIDKFNDWNSHDYSVQIGDEFCNFEVCMKLKTNSKKFTQKLKQTKEWLYQNNDLLVKELITMLSKKLVGHYKNYGVSHNSTKLSAFLHYVQRYLFKVINRRNHKKSYTCDGYIDMLKVYPLVKLKIYVKLF